MHMHSPGIQHAHAIIRRISKARSRARRETREEGGEEETREKKKKRKDQEEASSEKKERRENAEAEGEPSFPLSSLFAFFA